MFAFGIEHEVAFLNRAGQFADFVSTSFAEFDSIVADLPLYATDYPQLRIGDAGIKRKRWYIEGYERFNHAGQVIDCPPKGIEIRTTVHNTIRGAIDELHTSFRLLREKAMQAGFTPVLTSFHPYCTEFVPDPPLNAYEEKRRHNSPEKRTAFIPLLTYGPDLNLSCQGLDSNALIEIARKLTYYSPYIIPFSYSSPFFRGDLWEGLSIRTVMRTGRRPVALVFLADRADLLHSDPSLTKLARLPAEVGRIEFKACDSCDDFAIYAGLLALLKGLILDTTLTGRATVPDADFHQVSARQGFAHDDIAAGALTVLQAAQHALGTDEDTQFLAPLAAMLHQRVTPAHNIVATFQATGSIEATLCQSYRSYKP
ncbi:MAG: glutamate--cysteine ligase [Chloroflexi bacterium]|nr:MAG: glutamate--cysteine ligase [Chloroflexota bacterium]